MSIAIIKKVKFDGARCPFSTFLRLQGDHHCACAQKWRHFSFFSKSFQTKKIKALRPKMTKIASRGGSCLNWTPGPFLATQYDKEPGGAGFEARGALCETVASNPAPPGSLSYWVARKAFLATQYDKEPGGAGFEASETAPGNISVFQGGAHAGQIELADDQRA